MQSDLDTTWKPAGKDICVSRKGKRIFCKAGYALIAEPPFLRIKKHTAEICYKCHKKFNTEAANLFERASLLAGYEPETNALQHYVEALQYYDEALALQSDGAMLIKHRNKCNFRKVLSVLDEAINTIKFLLFNPVIVIAIVVGTGISAGLGYNNIAVKLFLFSFVYPLLWKMAYASWGERIYLLVVAIILLLVIF